MTFPEAILPGPMRLATVVLQPMTLGHALLLQRFGSPYAPGAQRGEPGSGDIALMLWVCSQGWQDAWLRRLSPIGRLWRSWFAGRIRPALAHYRVLADAYVGACWAGPKVRPTGEGSPLTAPSLGVLLAALMSEFWLTRDEALSTFVGEALWLVSIQGERNGVLSLDSEDGASLVDIAREIARQEAAATS